MDTNRLKQFWQDHQQVVMIVLAAGILLVLLLIARAATPNTQFEAESAKLAGNVSVKSDSSASGGSYVEFNASDPTTPPSSSGYGAGVQGAELAVPAGAVNVNPSNIVSEINSRPAGTAFHLADGTYKVGQLPNKAGNKYYGNPNNPNKVVFDGETKYTSLTTGNPDKSSSPASSGKLYTWNLLDNNIVANMTMRRYRGYNDEKGYGPLYSSGSANNVTVRNVILADNQFSGMRLGSSNWKVSFVTSYHNGQYGLSGGGTNNLVENALLYENGKAGLPYVPRYEKSDRGGTKFVFSKDLTFRNSEIYGHKDNGLWFDIGNSGMTAENNYIHDNTRHGIIYELSLGGGVIRNNNLVNNATGTQAQAYRDAGIFVNVGGDTLIEGNTINNARNGIILYQPNRDMTNAKPICGSVIKNNIIKGSIGNAWIGLNVAVTVNSCNPIDNPSQVTITNNNEQGPSVMYWLNSLVNGSNWSSKGYN